MLPQPGTMGAGRAFSLSQVEALEYFATNADRVATGTYDWWQLRSMFDATNAHRVANIGSNPANNGSITIFNVLTTPRGVRPAVWVRAD